MNKNSIILIGSLFIISLFSLLTVSAFAQGVSIDSSGNIEVGATNNNGTLELAGQPNSDAVVGITSGTGSAIHGENTDSGGLAGYFSGNVEVTGNLTANGSPVNNLATTSLTCGANQVAKWDGESSWVCAGVDWTELTGMPEDFSDGVDNVGSGGGSGVCDQTCVDGFNARIAALETLLTNFSKVSNNVVITGANLQVVSGSFATDGTVNGLGNIIIGYNEHRTGSILTCSLGQYIDQTNCESNGGTWTVSHKSGSHNLVLGKNHNYSSYGGIVVGHENAISAPNAAVTGGEFNTASNTAASISGGKQNSAIGYKSSISGGESNIASGESSHIGGGVSNTASASIATISGGIFNIASGLGSHVSGGGNFLSEGNEASADYSAILGGRENIASGLNSTVSGGWANTASGQDSSVSGGWNNTASGWASSVSGGKSRSATGTYWWAAGSQLEIDF